MNEDESQSDEAQYEHWMGKFEAECFQQLESEDNMEERLESERELAVQQLWITFQNSATAIAQLYKERHQGLLQLWLPFQSAALAVTNLYKDSIDRMQHCLDIGQQCGRYSRTRDIVAWVRKKHRRIRREELLGFLCGKTIPGRSRMNGASGRQFLCGGIERNLPRHGINHGHVNPGNGDRDLDAFKEAIVLQGLNGAMSNISMGFHGHGGSAQQVNAVSRGNFEDLNHFIHEEFSRNEGRKRSSSSPDLVIDSPSRKRSRLL